MLKSNIKPHTLTKKPLPDPEGVYIINGVHIINNIPVNSIFLDTTITQTNTDVLINNNPVVLCDHETGEIFYQINGIKTRLYVPVPQKQSKWVIFKERLIEGVRNFMLFLK